MNAHRFRNRIGAWLALAGIALNASWPLLANARPNVPALPSEVCSATGQKHGGEGLPGETPGKGARPSHCTLCPFNPERGAAISGASAPLPDTCFRTGPGAFLRAAASGCARPLRASARPAFFLLIPAAL